MYLLWGKTNTPLTIPVGHFIYEGLALPRI